MLKGVLGGGEACAVRKGGGVSDCTPQHPSQVAKAPRDLPIKPQKRGKVRGMRVCGITSISTFLLVSISTRRWPALFSGLSSRASSTWCTMSGRYDAGSRPCRLQMPWWSSQFSNSKPRFVFTVSKEHWTRMTWTVGEGGEEEAIGVGAPTSKF